MAGRRRGKKNKLQNLEEGPSVALAPPPRTKPILVGVESNVKSSQQGSRLPSPPSSQAKTDPPPFPRAHRNSRLKPEGDENGNAGRGSNVANLANSGIGSGVVQRRASKRPNTPPQCDRISLRNAACEDQRVDRGFNHCEIRGMEMAAAGIVLVCVVFAVIGVFSGSKKMVEKVDSALINVATLHEAVNQNKEKQSEAETRHVEVLLILERNIILAAIFQPA
ncbi:hypothetical protein BSKO_09191 [Bryopsis sp. KO-2023]|nr:hypothetical protein BSKO_09191 [Bryopsis sp. KO-2023]